MTDPINSLTETQSVIKTIHDLFTGTDEGDWSKVAACFSGRVLFDMSSMTGEDPQTIDSSEIVGAWESGLQHLEAVHHQIGNLQVDLGEAEANASCYGIAYHYLPNPTGQNTRVFVGSYDFHLSKADDGRGIDSFRFNLKFIDGNADLEGSG
jgi:hypothetical protein